MIPRLEEWSHDKVHRTVELAPPGLALAGVPSRTALLRDPEGAWRVEGAGSRSACSSTVGRPPADLPA